MLKVKSVALLSCFCLVLLVGCSNSSIDISSNQTTDVSTASSNTVNSENSDTESRLPTHSSIPSSDVSSEESTSSESNVPTVYLTAEKSGNTVTLRMKVRNNPGIAAFTVKVNYESEKLTAKSITSELSGFTSNLQQPNATLNGVVTAVYANLKGTAENRELFSITFEINDTAIGSTDFTISCDQDDFVAPNGTYINFKFENISITL